MTSSVARASSGREIVTSIVPDFSALLNLDCVEIVEDSRVTDQPAGKEDAATLKVSGPFPVFVTVSVVLLS